MKSSSRLGSSIAVLSTLLLFLPTGTLGRDKSHPTEAAQLTITVTGGEDKKPIDNASVYVRFVRSDQNGKRKVEMNLKTNLSGTCHAQDIPQETILIQVIAPGWKTFGEYFDVNQVEQTFNISLVRPPKWY